MKRTKGQASIEFFILFIVILSLLAVFLFFSTEIQNVVMYLTKYQQSSSVAFRVASAASAAVETEGIQIRQNIPVGFSIMAQPAAIFVTEKNTNTSASWPLPNVIVNCSVSENATSLNITFVNQTLYIIG